MEFSKDLLTLTTFWVGVIVIVSFAMIGVTVVMDHLDRQKNAAKRFDQHVESIPKD